MVPYMIFLVRQVRGEVLPQDAGDEAAPVATQQAGDTLHHQPPPHLRQVPVPISTWLPDPQQLEDGKSDPDPHKTIIRSRRYLRYKNSFN